MISRLSRTVIIFSPGDLHRRVYALCTLEQPMIGDSLYLRRAVPMWQQSGWYLHVVNLTRQIHHWSTALFLLHATDYRPSLLICLTQTDSRSLAVNYATLSKIRVWSRYHSLFLSTFYPCAALHSAVFAVMRCLSVRLSHAGIMSIYKNG